MKAKRKKLRMLVIGSLLVVVALLSAFWIWAVGTAYKPQEAAVQVFANAQSVRVSKEKFGYFFDGDGKDTAMIFYPGARVEYTAYAPMLERFARNGIDCFAVKMPFNMAFFGVNAADKILSAYDYAHWYLSGHSLGGAMAACYASEHTDILDGLILFAAYSTSDLKADDFTVISLWCNMDGVMNIEKFLAGRAYMPVDYHEICIEGGNHAGFGAYGAQFADGEAALSQEEQWDAAVSAVLQYVK